MYKCNSLLTIQNYSELGKWSTYRSG